MKDWTPTLADIGWTGARADWAATAEGTPGRIARANRGFSLVFTDGAAVLAASGSVRADTGIAPATGDWTTIVDVDGVPTLGEIGERTTTLARRAPGRHPEPQVLATNIDDVFVMHGLDRPINFRRLERQLTIAFASGATPVVLLTKSDEVRHAAEAAASVEKIAPGVEVIPFSTRTGENMDRVRSHTVPGRTVVLLGLSGIGKSTLVNELSGGQVQRTAEVRATDQKGRHTTVTRDLIPLPDGGVIIDTPGIREIGLWQAHTGIARTFAEITEAVEACRFGDCDHRDEPGCGVRAAVSDGTITARRLDHWRDLTAEDELQDTQLDEFARRAESRDRAHAERRANDERQAKRPSGKRRGGKGGSGKKKRR